MTETSASKPQPPISRGWFVALFTLSVFAGLLVVGVPYLREQQRLSFERQKAERRQDAFDRVKNGNPRVTIMDAKLLLMLASDADCIANLNELNFSMTKITPDDARFVSQLKNVQTLYFYDTDGANLVLEYAQNLPVTKMGFEMDRLSKASLHRLADFPVLTDVRFQYPMFPNEIAILESLPTRIAVHIPYPAENEPGYKERGEPRDAPQP